jgi:hypothetical protein
MPGRSSRRRIVTEIVTRMLTAGLLTSQGSPGSLSTEAREARTVNRSERRFKGYGRLWK